MFGRYFWRATLERAVKSFAQSLVALLSAQQLGLLEVDWVTTVSTAGMATLLSVLTSIGSSQIGDAEDPSVVAAPASPSTAPSQAPSPGKPTPVQTAPA
jgi:hypothetical protein